MNGPQTNKQQQKLNYTVKAKWVVKILALHNRSSSCTPLVFIILANSLYPGSVR